MENYSITVLTPPAEEPVSAQELWEHLNLNVALPAVEDLLNVFISAARQQFEHETDGRICLPTVFRQHLACFPSCPDTPVKLYRAEVLSVDSITYYDADDNLQTLSGWWVDNTGIPALLSMPTGSWPQVSAKRSRPVTIQFTAGWADKDAMPELVKLGIKLAAGQYYNVRESHSDTNYSETPLGFRRICEMYRTGNGGI